MLSTIGPGCIAFSLDLPKYINALKFSQGRPIVHLLTIVTYSQLFLVGEREILTEWGMIATAAELGITGLFFAVRRSGSALNS